MGHAAALLLWTAPGRLLPRVARSCSDCIPVALLVWFIGVMLVGGVLERSARHPGSDSRVWLRSRSRCSDGRRRMADRRGCRRASRRSAASMPSRWRRSSRSWARANAMRRRREIAWLHLNGLLMFAAAYLLLEDTHLALTGPLAAAFAAWHGVLAAGVLAAPSRPRAAFRGARVLAAVRSRWRCSSTDRR